MDGFVVSIFFPVDGETVARSRSGVLPVDSCLLYITTVVAEDEGSGGPSPGEMGMGGGEAVVSPPPPPLISSCLLL